MTAEPRSTLELLRELEPSAEKLLNRHLAMAVEWMPHEYVPWDQGRDFVTEPWEPGQSTLSPIAQTALEVNLLTEDNLPSYHHEIATAFGRHGTWGTWVHRWTAEEGRHSIAIRDFLLTTRGVDPTELERGRMQLLQTGYDSGRKTQLEVLAYVALQELATRIAHRNTGKLADDPVADKLLARVAADENLHMIFYRDLVSDALQVAPSAMVQAIATEVMSFQMPGTGIDGFRTKAQRIARAGIYDLRIHHDEVVWPLLRKWDFFELDGLTSGAEQARAGCRTYLAELDRLATRAEERRERARVRAVAAAP